MDAGLADTSRFHAVQVVPTEPDHATLVVVVGAGHTRVEGLDVASVARLLALMR